jgi:hypothetical protein
MGEMEFEVYGRRRRKLHLALPATHYQFTSSSLPLLEY